MPDVDFDVGIIGGGPAGSSMAAYLAKAGVKCAVFEREIFPRPHVGESLVPSSNRVFGDLGLFPKMEECKFPRKYGASWTSSSARVLGHNFQGMDIFQELEPETNASVRFEERKQPGVNQPYTYHVDRGKFDLMLLQHAQELGATVYQGIRVNGVDFSNKQHVVIRYNVGLQEFGTRVRMVVDASGRQTLLGVQEKFKKRDPVFDQYAIHTWFDNYDRGVLAKTKEQEDYIFIHHLPISNSWIWQIPITDTITSIGVVTQKKNFAKSKESREAYFWECIGSRPECHDALRKARQVRPLKDEGDYSYAMDQICGDRFVMVGDAARFVDPIFSTGVSIALNSSRFASRDIIRALEKGDLSRKSFETYEATIRRGVKNWYDFINVYYRLNCLFSAFVLDKRYRLDVLKLLQGDVYDDDNPPVLRKMQEAVRQIEQDENNALHRFLGNLTAEMFRPTF
jgi:1H-pyrrole-2-carbonyl-[peptidyl-carrier protein] chlorinase